jgi:hypothetical protein
VPPPPLPTSCPTQVHAPIGTLKGGSQLLYGIDVYPPPPSFIGLRSAVPGGDRGNFQAAAAGRKPAQRQASPHHHQDPIFCSRVCDSSPPIATAPQVSSQLQSHESGLLPPEDSAGQAITVRFDLQPSNWLVYSSFAAVAGTGSASIRQLRVAI